MLGSTLLEVSIPSILRTMFSRSYFEKREFLALAVSWTYPKTLKRNGFIFFHLHFLFSLHGILREMQMQMQMLSPFKGISSECLISFLTTFLPRPPLRTFGGFKGWEGEGAELPGWNACLDAYMYTIQVLTYLDGLPDNTWPEPDPKDPLSLVDKVTHKVTIQQDKVIRNLIYCIQKHSC